jgi:hypothetical protein
MPQVIEGLKVETFVSANTTIDKVKHVSNVTIDWSGITLDQLQALAQRSIVIRKQNEDRLAGVVPDTSYRINAVDYAIGVRRRMEKVVDIGAEIEKLTPEQLAVLMQKISAKLS